jgi:hypothetical protein
MKPKLVNARAACVATLSCMIFAQPAFATWSATAPIDKLNPGGNGLHGTYVMLQGATMPGCTVTTWAWLDGSNPNYKEFVASLIAAKAAGLQVQIGYQGCSGNYPLVSEIVVL